MKNTIVVVLGMHRSGTSVTTRSLELLGVGLGNNLHPASFDNPKGFWEDEGIIEINNQLLERYGSAYDQICFSADDGSQNVNVDDLKQAARSLVRESLSESGGLWGVKDPRMCRLLHFWQDVFKSLNCEVKYVLAIRNPKSVADSLFKRNNISYEKSYILWMQHVLSSFVETKGMLRVVVDYDLFVENPLVQLARMANVLGFEVPDRESPSFRVFSQDFLDKSLRHSHIETQDLDSIVSVPADVKILYKTLLNAARDEYDVDGSELAEIVDSVSKRFEACAYFASHIRELEIDLNRLHQVVSDYEGQVAERDLKVTSLEVQLAAILNSRRWRIVSWLAKLKPF